jgi:bifunctional DNA-binding transcriptional regulator/antitoxin component of YhaV-PrlF toxin-antitoxin module
MTRLKLKTANVKAKNVIVQLPKLVVDLWNIKPEDKLDIFLSEDIKSVIIKKADSDEGQE